MHTKTKFIVGLIALLATPVVYAVDCAETQSKYGTWQYAKSNPPECLDENNYRNGRWEIRWADGRVDTAHYVDGEKHGRWEWQRSDGTVDTGEYVNGEKHGQWKIQHASGDVETGRYVDGKRHGQWELRLVEGLVLNSNYVHGEQQ